MAGGFGRANLRLIAGQPAGDPYDDITIDTSEDDPDQPDINEDGQILRIEHGDGSVTISMNDRPLIPQDEKAVGGWFRNLVGELGDQALGTITEDLMRGVADDIESRREWVDTVATFIKLLGVTIEVPNLQGAADAAPVEGMSRVRHPLLLEAVLRFQANFRGEMLPTDGPVKCRNDNQGGVEYDLMANNLEEDLNHYLTVHATEYVPDTDRMAFRLGLEGTTFKKVYRCPLRLRPVSETVIATDLIVSNDATDLQSARRVTHRIMMGQNTIKRMQILEVYADVDLGTPVEPDLDEAARTARQQQGVADTTPNPDDRDRELYECYCDLNVPGFEHQWKGRPSGLEIPYRVTIDVTSRQVLSLVRDYNPPPTPDTLPKRRETFVQYTYVPGLGFYGLGLGHILGNTTNAITAAWREMLDNGMFANFPGFLVAKGATRQQTSILRVPPGGGQPIDTLGKPISQAVMPLPYNTAQMPPLMQLVESMATSGARIGGTAEIQIGEGKQDAPVGTTLALIDQATKIEGSAHKRLHASQAREFQLLKELFREHPEDFLDRECTSGAAWDEQSFLQALNNCNIVPQADPNTAGQLQRLMRAMGLLQLSAQAQSLYDPIRIHSYALRSMGVNQPQQFFAPPSAMAQPPPQLQQMQADMKAKLQAADARTQDSNARAAVAKAKLAEVQAKSAQGGFGPANQQAPTTLDGVKAKASLMDAETRRFQAHAKVGEMAEQSRDRQMGRQAEAQSDQVDLIKALLAHDQSRREAFAGHLANAHQAAQQQAHDAREGEADRASDLKQAELQAKSAEKVASKRAAAKPAAKRPKKD